MMLKDVKSLLLIKPLLTNSIMSKPLEKLPTKSGTTSFSTKLLPDLEEDADLWQVDLLLWEKMF
jgi:hypothetical protein